MNALEESIARSMTTNIMQNMLVSMDGTTSSSSYISSGGGVGNAGNGGNTAGNRGFGGSSGTAGVGSGTSNYYPYSYSVAPAGVSVDPHFSSGRSPGQSDLILDDVPTSGSECLSIRSSMVEDEGGRNGVEGGRADGGDLDVMQPFQIPALSHTPEYEAWKQQNIPQYGNQSAEQSPQHSSPRFQPQQNIPESGYSFTFGAPSFGVLEPASTFRSVDDSGYEKREESSGQYGNSPQQGSPGSSQRGQSTSRSNRSNSNSPQRDVRQQDRLGHHQSQHQKGGSSGGSPGAMRDRSGSPGESQRGVAPTLLESSGSHDRKGVHRLDGGARNVRNERVGGTGNKHGGVGFGSSGSRWIGKTGMSNKNNSSIQHGESERTRNKSAHSREQHRQNFQTNQQKPASSSSTTPRGENYHNQEHYSNVGPQTHNYNSNNPSPRYQVLKQPSSRGSQGMHGQAGISRRTADERLARLVSGLGGPIEGITDGGQPEPRHLGLNWSMPPPPQPIGEETSLPPFLAGPAPPAQSNFFGWEELENLVEEEISRFNQFYLDDRNGGGNGFGDYGGRYCYTGGNNPTIQAEGLLAQIFDESEVSKGILTKALPHVGGQMSPKTRPLTAPTVVNKNGTPAYYSTFDYKRPDDVDRMGPPPRCHTAVVATRSARRRSSITYDLNGVRKLTAPPVKKTDRDTNFVQKNVAEAFLPRARTIEKQQAAQTEILVNLGVEAGASPTRRGENRFSTSDGGNGNGNTSSSSSRPATSRSGASRQDEYNEYNNPAAKQFFEAVEGKMIEERYRQELWRAESKARECLREGRGESPSTTSDFYVDGTTSSSNMDGSSSARGNYSSLEVSSSRSGGERERGQAGSQGGNGKHSNTRGTKNQRTRGQGQHSRGKNSGGGSVLIGGGSQHQHGTGGKEENVRKAHYQHQKRVEAQQDWTVGFLGML